MGISATVLFCSLLHHVVRICQGLNRQANSRKSKAVIGSYIKTKNLPEQITRVSETESGTKSYKSRQLGALIEQLHQGDILLISELSRLGRSLFEVMELLGRLMEKDVQVMSIKEGFEL
jgi:DNA invertase Pin-like site-specific DNA recombinase